MPTSPFYEKTDKKELSNRIRSEAVVAAIDRQRLSPFLAQIAATVAEVSPDAVVVTWDTVTPAQVRLLSATLRTTHL